jgi:hypothetical protein
MTLYRPYIQTSIFNFLIGIEIPIASLTLLAEILLNPTATHQVEYFILFPLLILAGLYLKKLINIVVGIGIPAICLFPLVEALRVPIAAHEIYYLLLLPLFILAGFYFLIWRCVWFLRCDEENRTLSFVKTFRRLTIPIKEIKELTVFETLRGFAYRFKTLKSSVTLEEMDDMPELIEFLKKINPQININSPEDHKSF